MRILFALFLLAHGLIHASYLSPAPPTNPGAPEWPFSMARSWLVTGLRVDVGVVRAMGTLLVVVVVVGFALSGMAWLGIVVPAGVVAGPGHRLCLGFGCPAHGVLPSMDRPRICHRRPAPLAGDGRELAGRGGRDAVISVPHAAPQVPGRRPRWSGALTRPLARHIPVESRNQALVSIKAVHTALFVSIAAAVLLTLWDGIRGRPRQRTAMAGFVVLAETAVYVSNNQVCPLTPLAEQLGAERGSVVDIFLPDWAARRIPIVAGTAVLAALVLNGRTVLPTRRLSS